jgi:wyosine [tRNA(Phe)-imidazoG37] synthetase (radical SAM superfamily)
MMNFATYQKYMAGFLFHDVIFGPVRSRRLGVSLGINLLPLHSKFCSFNCIYCECGWTPLRQADITELPSRTEVSDFLDQRLEQLVEESLLPDALTFAGNGEPTLHPEFAGIVDDTIRLRNQYVPAARVTVLSNGSMISDTDVFKALSKLDNNIQKLDAGFEDQLLLINNPVGEFRLDEYIENLKKFNGNVIIQSLFLRGSYKGSVIDNTTDLQVEEWLRRLDQVRPRMVMIYPIARATPAHDLVKIAPDELNAIATRVKNLGIDVAVYQ